MLLEDMMGNLRRKDEADQQSKHCSAGVSQEQRANRFSLTSTKIAIVSHGAQQEKLPHYQQSTTHSRELSLSATCEYESQAISFINSKGEATINSEIAERIIKRKEKTDTDEQNSVSNANTGDVFMSAVNQNVEKGITGTTMASSGIIPTTVSSGSGEPSFENVANDCSSPNRDHMSLSDVQRPDGAKIEESENRGGSVQKMKSDQHRDGPFDAHRAQSPKKTNDRKAKPSGDETRKGGSKIPSLSALLSEREHVHETDDFGKSLSPPTPSSLWAFYSHSSPSIKSPSTISSASWNARRGGQSRQSNDEGLSSPSSLSSAASPSSANSSSPSTHLSQSLLLSPQNKRSQKNRNLQTCKEKRKCGRSCDVPANHTTFISHQIAIKRDSNTF
eukprot:Selendium_serpulae@DN6426_c3_g2_i8.p1